MRGAGIAHALAGYLVCPVVEDGEIHDDLCFDCPLYSPLNELNEMEGQPTICEILAKIDEAMEGEL